MSQICYIAVFNNPKKTDIQFKWEPRLAIGLQIGGAGQSQRFPLMTILPDPESSNTCLYGFPRDIPAYPLLFEADLLPTGIALDRLVELLFGAAK